MPYTTDDLDAAVRRLAYIPDASDITAAELLLRADEEMSTLIAEEIKAGREGFWLTSEDQALISAVTAYQIPQRALGGGVVGVQMVNSTGTAFTIPQIDPVTGWNGRTTTINSYCYSFQGDKIVFPTSPPTGYTLRVLYLRKPSRMVPTTSAAAIVKALSTTTLQIVSAPATWTYPIYVDIIRGDRTFDPSYVDLTASSLVSTTLTVSAIATADFVDTTAFSNARQDYVCRQEETVYPMVPSEVHRVLEVATALHIAGSMNDAQRVATLSSMLAVRRRAVNDILEPRNQEGSRPITRSRSPLRQTFGIGRRWR